MPVGVFNAQAVVLENKVYIGGGSMSTGPSSILLVYDFIKDLWDMLDTPTQWYTFTSYNSQLVLVGGMDPNTGTATNQLWVLDEQRKWTQPLSPMTIERYQASAVNVGGHLIVAGGQYRSHVGPLDKVEVYDGHQRRKVQSLPSGRSWMKSVLHEGKWYLDGGAQAEEDCKIYYTSLESLIATTYSEGISSHQCGRSYLVHVYFGPLLLYSKISLSLWLGTKISLSLWWSIPIAQPSMPTSPAKSHGYMWETYLLPIILLTL